MTDGTDWYALHEYYSELLARANSEVAKQPVTHGVPTAWLKIQSQAFKLLQQCKKEIAKQGNIQIDELQELGL